MAAKVSSRVVLNRKALTALQGSFADAMADMGREVIDVAKPPDARPFGQGLVTTGDWGVWAGSRKVEGTAQKPRAARLIRGFITLLVGFGFPGRFQEMGTVNHGAQPFLTPAVMQVVPQPEPFFRSTFRRIAGRFR